MHSSAQPIEIVYKNRWAKLRKIRATTSCSHKETESKSKRHFIGFLQSNICSSTWSTKPFGRNTAKFNLSEIVICQCSLVTFTSAWNIYACILNHSKSAWHFDRVECRWKVYDFYKHSLRLDLLEFGCIQCLNRPIKTFCHSNKRLCNTSCAFWPLLWLQ